MLGFLGLRFVYALPSLPWNILEPGAGLGGKSHSVASLFPRSLKASPISPLAWCGPAKRQS